MCEVLYKINHIQMGFIKDLALMIAKNNMGVAQ
jgi:hypothetical protein